MNVVHDWIWGWRRFEKESAVATKVLMRFLIVCLMNFGYICTHSHSAPSLDRLNRTMKLLIDHRLEFRLHLAENVDGLRNLLDQVSPRACLGLT
jgi:hypothetical protein